MTISFNQIPSTIRTPFLFTEFDTSKATGGNVPAGPSLLIGQRTSGGAVAEAVPTRVFSASQAAADFGVGSQLALMCAAYLANDPSGELWAIALDDNVSGVAASGTLTVTGPATADGTISLYIAGVLIEVAVTDGDSANTVAAAIEAAIDADTDLPVTASVSTNVVTVTAKNDGTSGNDIDMRLNYLGPQGGQELPAGVGVAVVAMASGATNPALSTAITAMADSQYDYIGHPYDDATNLNAMRDELDEDTGRWSYDRALYGHAWAYERDTVANLQTFGGNRNDGHHTVIGVEPVPSYGPAIVGAYVGSAARALRNDPARPLQSLRLKGHEWTPMLAAADSAKFTRSERDTLLNNGIATIRTVGGQLQIERSISTYQTDANSNADTTWLDVTTASTLWTIAREWEARIEGKYPRHKLVADGTRFGAGQAIVTPSIIKGEAIALYRDWESRGLVEDADAFIAASTFEINGSNPNRLDVLLAPDLANQLRNVATVMQPRL